MDSRKRLLRQIEKHVCYFLLFFVLYVVQTTPGLFSLGGVKPVWLVALAVVIATQEGEFVGALYGGLAGFFWELAAGRSMGFFSIFLLMLCFATAIVFTLYLRATLLNVSLAVGTVMLFLCSIDFVFSYWLQGHGGTGWIYLYRILPVTLYTTLITFICRFAARKIMIYFAQPV